MGAASGHDYDLAVLGAGSGGGAAAAQAARRGGRVCLIEQGPIGGVCLNVGCIPTKAMLAASDVCRRMRACGQFGIAAAEPRVDGRAFMKRAQDVVAELRRRAEAGTQANSRIELIRGRGRLAGGRTILVRGADGGERLISAGAIVIATGARPARPGFLPWGCPRVLTTDEAVVAADLPASVLVMGGGPIGCEFATIYVELGIRTHLVEMQPALLPGLDADAGKLVARLLAERGADVRVGAKIVSMTDTGDGLAVTFEDGGALHVDAALVAVGRRPNVEDIGLEAAGIELADGIIPVDEHCRTRAEGIYAVGDVAERRQYAHLADRMGVVAADDAMGVPTADDRTVVPVGVYTHPEVAAVGLTLAEAKQRSDQARAFRYSYSASSTGLAYGETDGMLKVIADADSGRIHGAAWIGPHAIDMIQEFALAMRHGLTMGQLHETIHAHPTFQEAAGGVAAAWEAAAMRKRA